MLDVCQRESQLAGRNAGKQSSRDALMLIHLVHCHNLRTAYGCKRCALCDFQKCSVMSALMQAQLSVSQGLRGGARLGLNDSKVYHVRKGSAFIHCKNAVTLFKQQGRQQRCRHCKWERARM